MSVVILVNVSTPDTWPDTVGRQDVSCVVALSIRMALYLHGH